MVNYRRHIVNNKTVEIRTKHSNNKNYRFVYKIKFTIPKGSKDELIVICMNPSKADTQISDTTVNMLIEHTYESNYKGMILLNVFPLYEPNSSNLPNNTVFNNDNNSQYMMELNVRFISYILYKYGANDILLAFGRPGNKKYMKVSMEKIIDHVIKSLAKFPNKNVSKLAGFPYFHHPKAYPLKYKQVNKKIFSLDSLNSQILLSSKSSL